MANSNIMDKYRVGCGRIIIRHLYKRDKSMELRVKIYKNIISLKLKYNMLFVDYKNSGTGFPVC